MSAKPGLFGLCLLLLAFPVNGGTVERGGTMKDLRALLDQRIDAAPRGPEVVAAIDARIRARFEHKVAVMVTDLSGFTARTRAKGVIASLATIRQMQRDAAGVIARHGGRLVKADADDLFVIHDDPRRMLDLARDLVKTLKRDPGPDGTGLTIAAGLSYGPVLLIGDDELFGDAVNSASKLGEDVGRGGEVLATQELVSAIGLPDQKLGCVPMTPEAAHPPYFRCPP
jgi:adenylate cyclase